MKATPKRTAEIERADILALIDERLADIETGRLHAHRRLDVFEWVALGETARVLRSRIAEGRHVGMSGKTRRG